MAPQALHDAVAVLERPLTHLGIIKQTSPFSSFYSLQGVDIDGQPVDFGAYRDKVCALGSRVGLGLVCATALPAPADARPCARAAALGRAAAQCALRR